MIVLLKNPAMIQKNSPNYRWYVLAITMFTYGIVTGTARLCMPVLFKQISDDIGLTVTQLGAVWGMDPLAGVFIGLPGGLLADRFGVRRTIAVVCILAGVFGAMRGVAVNFYSMAAIMFLFGLTVAAVPSVAPKVTAEWFGGRQLGMANAMINIAWGVGAMVATMFSATALSPLLGSWRWVMLFYGVPCAVLGLLWLTTRDPDKRELPDTVTTAVPLKEALSKVSRIKQVWIIGLVTFFIWGASMGLIGYLPYYLRDIGWTATSADSVITVFSGVTAIGVIPMVYLSDRIGSRKIVMAIGIIAMIVSLALIPTAGTAGVWTLVIICGFLRSGASTLVNVVIFETKGVGSTYGGTATGLANTISMLGAFLAPPIGNSLATEANPGNPFYFWAAMAAASLPLLFFIKNRTGQSIQS